ncbi:MAG: hypothetical protein AB8B74_15265 [Crocinitomicaceae bacterium]
MNYFTAFLFVIFALHATAQKDTTIVDSYDIVYLKKGGFLKGKIISFDPSDGDITFVEADGTKYFLTTLDYESFKENVPSRKKRKAKELELKERKKDQFEVGLGLSIPFYKATSDPTAITGNNRFTIRDEPLSLTLGFGRYFSRRHYAGLNIDFSGSNTKSMAYMVAARYAHQYDGNQKNFALYIPIDLAYGYIRDRQQIPYPPITNSYDFAIGFAGLTLGHGIQFILNRKNSIAIEVGYMKHFVVSQKNFTDNTKTPLDFEMEGFRINAKYNF